MDQRELSEGGNYPDLHRQSVLVHGPAELQSRDRPHKGDPAGPPGAVTPAHNAVTPVHNAVAPAHKAGTQRRHAVTQRNAVTPAHKAVTPFTTPSHNAVTPSHNAVTRAHNVGKQRWHTTHGGRPGTPQELASVSRKGAMCTCSYEQEVEAVKMASTWIRENCQKEETIQIETILTVRTC